MQIVVEVADEAGVSYGEIYGYPEGSKITLEEFIGGSLATYLENAHVGYQVRAQEQAIKQPFEQAQTARAEAAKPPEPEKTDAEVLEAQPVERVK